MVAERTQHAVVRHRPLLTVSVAADVRAAVYTRAAETGEAVSQVAEQLLRAGLETSPRVEAAHSPATLSERPEGERAT